jgi:hypothetical protein
VQKATTLDNVETTKTVNGKKEKKLKRQIAVENPREEVIKTKRTFKDLADDDFNGEQEQLKPKKKLKIVDEIQRSQSSMSVVNGVQNDHKKLKKQNSLPITMNKIKQIIPQDVKVEKPKKESKKGFAFPEPKKFPPRPVWTSSGYFLEESLTPQKKSNQTIPVTFSGSVSVGLSDEKKGKKKDRKKPALDFKSKQLLLKQLKRDGSMKNIKGLMMKKC